LTSVKIFEIEICIKFEEFKQQNSLNDYITSF